MIESIMDQTQKYTLGKIVGQRNPADNSFNFVAGYERFKKPVDVKKTFQQLGREVKGVFIPLKPGEKNPPTHAREVTESATETKKGKHYELNPNNTEQTYEEHGYYDNNNRFVPIGKDNKNTKATHSRTITKMGDRIKSAGKATRAIKAKGPKAADKQVAKVNYKKQDTEFKLVSIPPIQVVGKRRLFTFNPKTRVITEFVTAAVNGFSVSGSTLKDFDEVNSRCTRLRKPNEFLPFALSKTPNQIDKEWKNLTTKTTVPNGRINKDTILLRVLDK